MSDQFPQITLDPSLTAQPKPVGSTPVTPAHPAVAASVQSAPLQSVPPVSAEQVIQPLSKTPAIEPLPAAAPAPSNPHVELTDRRSQVQAELERLQQEESSLLNNIKDWLTKVQGAETKQQALERELFALDRKLAGTPSPAQLAAERETQLAQLTQELQQAQNKVKEITKLQKIDEKKAFDNYSAGGLDRQGLLDQMELIRQRYEGQLAAVQKMAETAQQAIEQLNNPEPQSTTLTPISESIPELPQLPVTPTPSEPQPMPAPQAVPPVTAAPQSVQPAPAAGTGSPLIMKLAALPEATNGLLHRLVVELPNQGTWPLIERSNDGNGILISADANAQAADRCFVADADLLRAGATAEDIIPLATSQFSSKDATPLPVVTA